LLKCSRTSKIAMGCKANHRKRIMLLFHLLDLEWEDKADITLLHLINLNHPLNEIHHQARRLPMTDGIRDILRI
jgi:hypothetical protein